MKPKSRLLISFVVLGVAVLMGVLVYAGRVRASARKQHAESTYPANPSPQVTPIGHGQRSTAACSYSVTPTSQSFAAAGGAGSVNVSTGAGCTWTAIAGYSWITITSGASGTGSGTVSYTVAANAEVINQIGTILIAGQFVAISQSGAGKNCSAMALTIPQTVDASLSGADCRSITDETTYADLYSFSAQAGQRVAISLGSAQFDAWLTLLAPDGSIIAVNDDNNSNISTDSRIPPGSDFFVLPVSGTYLIDASSYYSNEVGSYTLSLSAPIGQTCTYSVSPMTQSFTASGGNGSLNVSTSPGCGWTAGDDVAWITFNAGESGVGSGSISFTVAPNTSLGFRGATVLIAGQLVSVVQAGTGGNCAITPLVVPQNVNGSWTPGGCTSPLGSLSDLYSFSGQAGQQIAISLTTTSSFTSIYLYLSNGFLLFSEGDGNLRLPLTSGIFFVLPFTGTFVVEVGAGGAGTYALGLLGEQAQACTPVIGLNTNRLCNPGAELGSGGTSETEIVAIPGWTTTSNFTVTRYGVPELPTMADSTRIGGGNNFFTGGPNTASSSATQTVSVSDEATGIDAGLRSAQLQAYLGGYPGDDDSATVRAEYLNAGGTPLGTPLMIGPANGSLHLVTNSGAVPPGTRSIRVTLLAARVHGSYNDAYFDNVSLTLSQSGGASCPTIGNLSPTNGAVGSTVTITGTNFTGVTAVKFSSNVTASFAVNSNMQITATVPNGAVTGPITISKTGCSDVQTTAFTVTAPCVAVAISTGLTGPSGGTLTVPISVSDTTGRGVIAYDFTLTFDPAVLRPQTAAIDKTGTLSAAMTVTPNSSVSGQLVVSAFGATALTGAGTLLNVKFDVIGASSSCSNLNWVSFRFNEGTPCSTMTSGRACAVGGSIAGTVSYCITPKPVPNVTISAAGTPSAMSTTGGAGTYQLTGLGGGPYTVTPAKTGDVNGIASFDAALIAQHAAMLTTLNSCQQVAADTSGEGGITSFDAALVAQHTVGIANASSKVGTWKFVPATRDYPTLTGDQTNQNYNAVLVGDVSGNWAAAPALVEDQPQRDPLLAQQDVQVALPELVAGGGTSLILPITVGDLTGRGVLAYDFDLIYNASLLQSQVQPVETSDTLSSNFTVTPNATAGRLRVSGFGAVPLTGSGILLKLRFNVIGAIGSNTMLSWQAFQFNEGSPAVASVPGRVTIINIYTLSLTPTSQTVPVGSSASLTLVSSVTQPVAVTYPVISSNSAIASAPSSVMIPANATMTTFNVMPNAAGGPVTITAGYASLPGAPLATAMVTVVRRVTCVSAASFAGEGQASESIVAGFGTSLATSTQVGATVPLPTQLAGTTVNVRDSLGVSRLAPLFFVSDGQINFQIPAGTALGTATVTVTSGIGTVSSGVMAIVKVAPGLFTANSDGGGVPAAYIIRVKPDGQQIAQDVWMLNQQTARFVPREIDLTISGDRVFLILFGTGIRSYDSISDVVVRFGTEDQQVDAALPQGFFVGLDQVNVEMVRSKIPPGPVTVTLRVEGVAARSVDILVK